MERAELREIAVGPEVFEVLPQPSLEEKRARK